MAAQKVLVTGADGFIGSHLVQALLAKGTTVKAFVQYNSFNHWGWLDTLPKDELQRVEIFSGDLRDSFGVDEAVSGCTHILHLGALIAIPYSYHSPQSYVDTNIHGTLNILQAARRHRCERVLITSTSEVYGTALYTPIDEKHPRQGQSPYSATKIGADNLAESYYRSFDLPVTIVRPFNTYGPRQSSRAFIPTVIIQLLAGKDRISMGSLDPTRDLVYVKDTAEGFIRLMEASDCIGEEVNIASGVDHSIGKVAQTIIDIINPNARIIEDEQRIRPAKSEVMQLLGSTEKLEGITGWRPQTSLEEGLAETISWFQDEENRRGYKADIYNI